MMEQMVLTISFISPPRNEGASRDAGSPPKVLRDHVDHDLDIDHVLRIPHS